MLTNFLIETPQNINNPIQESIRRRIPNGAFRVVSVTALIFPCHITATRTDFPRSDDTSTPYMRTFLNGLTTDE
ncbi:unnamed protein product [Didymodactylos carnosus]|uniref:Uncharacterized protein n=1 Tax=Didymodactylos carnosus TaxID=1234261 RepID=A0A815MNR2_9BILA|nr:unnamed protein product [Didymodactylos carnosus]CAF4307371.1 unnamed protein product [Didymodactylos carnosus]